MKRIVNIVLIFAIIISVIGCKTEDKEIEAVNIVENTPSQAVITENEQNTEQETEKNSEMTQPVIHIESKEDQKEEKQDKQEEGTVIGKAKSETRLVREKVMYIPGAQFDTIRYLKEGEEFELIEAGCEWHKVKAGDDEGYVLARDVSGVELADSPYYICIEKGSHTINVYQKDGNDEYTKLVKTFITATGATAGKTPTGVFYIYRKREWKQFDSGGDKRDYSYSPFVSQFAKGIYIHGSVYAEEDFDKMFGNTYREIGTDSTAGCLRTNAGSAYWIYANCPLGTKVEIVNGSPRGIETPILQPPVKKGGSYYDPTTPNLN